MIKLTSTHNDTHIPRYSYQKENSNCINKTNCSPIDKTNGHKIFDDLEARKVQKQTKVKRFD